MKVSACMIARNEQEMLPRCLESIKWADELIFVDTGSTDKTIEIAKDYGAKVYEHPWQNDFSLHRNQSLSYASNPWVMIIDCDEQVVSDMTHFKSRLDKVHKSVNALVVKVLEKGEGPKSSWLGLRFFRKSSGIHYKGIVHNKASYKGGCAATDIVFNHYGYSLSPEKMQAKRERTQNLLIARLQDHPKDHAALYYMCQLKVGEKDYESAESFGLRFFECVPVHPKEFEFYGVMYFYMAWIYLHLGDGNKSAAWALKGLEFYPEDVDLNCIMARIGYQAQRDDWLKSYGEKYLSLVKAIRDDQQEPDTFVSAVSPLAWSNRTIYTLEADQCVKQLMGVL